MQDPSATSRFDHEAGDDRRRPGQAQATASALLIGGTAVLVEPESLFRRQVSGTSASRLEASERRPPKANHSNAGDDLTRSDFSVATTAFEPSTLT